MARGRLQAALRCAAFTCRLNTFPFARNLPAWQIAGMSRQARLKFLSLMLCAPILACAQPKASSGEGDGAGKVGATVGRARPAGWSRSQPPKPAPAASATATAENGRSDAAIQEVAEPTGPALALSTISPQEIPPREAAPGRPQLYRVIADNTVGCTDAETLLVRRGLRRAPATPVRAGRTDANCQPTFITNEWSLVRIEGETALLRLENAVAGGPPVLLYVLKTEVVGPDGHPPP